MKEIGLNTRKTEILKILSGVTSLDSTRRMVIAGFGSLLLFAISLDPRLSASAHNAIALFQLGLTGETLRQAGTGAIRKWREI